MGFYIVACTGRAYGHSNRPIKQRLRQTPIFGGDIRAQNFIIRGGINLARIHDRNGQQRRALAYPAGKPRDLAQYGQGVQQQKH